MEEQLNFVDKSLVHKTKDENVHIYNMRRALPREIDVATFETSLIPNLKLEEQEFVKEYYIKGEGSKGEAYILRTIPFRISFQLADVYLRTAEVDEEERKFLRDFYKPDATNSKYVLQKTTITEEEELKILKILDGRDLHISDNERWRLSNLFEKQTGLLRKEIYFANVHIDPNHYYFYEHKVEHVSGMLLIEVARQMSMACAHVYGNVPLNAVFMLTKLDNTFTNYSELHYPIKVRAKLDKVEKELEGIWTSYSLTFTFYQRHKVTCISLVEAMIVNQTIFKKIRRDKEIYDQLPRFRPISEVRNNISIRAGGKRYLCSIVDLSLEGFMLQFEDNSFKQEQGEVVDFFMFFDQIGFIHGKAVIRWKEALNNGSMAGFQMTETGDIDKENMKEAMKFYFKVKEDREIL